MIVMLFLSGLFALFSALTTPIQMPSLPDSVMEYSYTLAEYIGTGASILSVYTDLTYILVLFGIIVAADVSVMLYKFVMWVIRKIPLANIS